MIDPRDARIEEMKAALTEARADALRYCEAMNRFRDQRDSARSERDSFAARIAELEAALRIEGSGYEPGCIARARSASPAIPAQEEG